MEGRSKWVRTKRIIVVRGVFKGCQNGNQDVGSAQAGMSVEDLSADIAMLASDEFEGRGPSTRGEERTIAYLQQEFADLGLEPGNGESYFQEVPLVELTTSPGSGMVIWTKEITTGPSYRREYVAWTTRVVDRVSLSRSDLASVGCGVVASY